MFTLSQLEFYRTKPKRLIIYLQRLLVLQPAGCMCPSCGQTRRGTLRLRPYAQLSDGYCLHCPKCQSNYSVRFHSFFSRSRLPLLTLCKLLVYFSQRLTTVQISQLLTIPRQTISGIYSWVRGAMHTYLQAHPIFFDSDEVVEVDEKWMHSIYYYNERGEAVPAHWIVGIVSRSSGKCYIEVVLERTKAVLHKLIRERVGPGATIISDEWAGYQGLEDQYDYKSVKKWKRGKHSYPCTYTQETTLGEEIEVHTNTIEGLWAELDSHVHASRGWGAAYMWAVLAEFMYHKARFDFLVALQP